MNDEKPQWFLDHEKADEIRHEEVMRTLAPLKDITDNYNAAIRVGPWVKWTLGLILLVLSIVVAVKQIR